MCNIKIHTIHNSHCHIAHSSPAKTSDFHCRRVAYSLCLIYPNVMQILSFSNEKSLEKTQTRNNRAHTLPPPLGCKLRRVAAFRRIPRAFRIFVFVHTEQNTVQRNEPVRPCQSNNIHQTIPHRWCTFCSAVCWPIPLRTEKPPTNVGPECANPLLYSTQRYVCV